MKNLAIAFVLLIAQTASMQTKKIVHLLPHRNVIEVEFGGKRLQVMNPPPELQLPDNPPKIDDQGLPWAVEVENLGPGTTTVMGRIRFSVLVSTHQVVQIYSDGSGYSLKLKR